MSSPFYYIVYCLLLIFFIVIYLSFGRCDTDICRANTGILILILQKRPKCTYEPTHDPNLGPFELNELKAENAVDIDMHHCCFSVIEKSLFFIYFQTVLEVGVEQPNPTVNIDSKQFSQRWPVISTN